MTNLSGAQSYNVYVSEANTNSWKKLDRELVRNYGTYGRADALGLKAGKLPTEGGASKQQWRADRRSIGDGES